MEYSSTIYLASRSPRRQELLRQIGIDFQLIDIDVDESLLADERPEAYVKRVAELKAMAGYRRLAVLHRHPVLAADTSVVLEGQILGKPESREHGIWMLSRLSGNTHEVYSAVTLSTPERQTRISLSQVTFRKMSQREILDYWDTGEPADKAGSYAIQGLGALFVARLEGSYSGVMGLPLFETAELLQRVGIKCLGRVT
jgi:septum formation protein